MGATTKPQDCTLLVVDDEPNRDLLGRRLQREGYPVALAASGPEALDVLAKGRIALVLLDVMMPEMSGLDVLRAMRAIPALAAVPV